MGHPVPSDLKGDSRVLTIPYVEIPLTQKGLIYVGIASMISAISLTVNLYLFLILFFFLNIGAYILGHMKIETSKFEGGNLHIDVYIYKKIKYKRNRNVYVRKRSE